MTFVYGHNTGIRAVLFQTRDIRMDLLRVDSRGRRRTIDISMSRTGSPAICAKHTIKMQFQLGCRLEDGVPPRP